eukprot:scaffold44573_cov25-Tisochrysis_lutea.AAC.1
MAGSGVAGSQVMMGGSNRPGMVLEQQQPQEQGQQQQQQHGWQPACLNRVHIVGGGRPRELCAPRELSRHPM